MSNEPNGPGEGVRDGERDGTRHIPRDPRDDEGTTATDRPGPGEQGEARAAGNGKPPGGTDNVTRAPGPAEDRDSESPDTRGLTTDASPSE
ncbi:hypothetical protein AB4089_22100 [Arthrobacter sp. 2MCAF15]|uniref:hypothetical protein n=1 Tax=Arthrobacter sp. 2MCAF15 TaxID=3232984 RepID=UPI003F91E6C9